MRQTIPILQCLNRYEVHPGRSGRVTECGFVVVCVCGE